MGAESFFIHLIPEGVEPVQRSGLNGFRGETDILVGDFTKRLAAKLGLRGVSERFVFEETLVVSVGSEDDRLQHLSIEGCLSWFEEGLCDVLRLAAIVNEITPIYLAYPSDYRFGIEERQLFLETMGTIYQEKRAGFRELCGDIHERISPADFYSWRRRQRRA